MHKFLMFLFCVVMLSRHLSGEDTGNYYTDAVFDERIKTVQLYKEGWNLSYPVMKLFSDEKLILHFDLLDENIEDYYYTFYHCSKDWVKSDVFSSEYLEGFPENPIEEFTASFNTTVNYFHYKLVFPNERVKLTISGNYILFVYADGHPEDPVLTRRFIITEDAANVEIDMHRPLVSSNYNTGQQVDFRVNIGGLDLTDPYRNIYSFILQNGRWDNAKKNLKPDITGGNELIYNSLSEENIFDAGNEFRYFDIRSIKYLSEYLVSIDYLAPNYHIYLRPSENRQLRPYFHSQDFNGKFYIASAEGRDADTDADYVYVYFTLPAPYLQSDSRVYVMGYLSDWKTGKNNLMTYNHSKGQYECTMFLKQGVYNYEYMVAINNVPVIPSGFEGSHYETENDYMILVYYRNPRDRYDRLLTTASANTFNNLSR
ncbi:MAG TPA: DUF5103 domain-containing protein [Bacteroidales bacterium]|nr:DUF5103 domain-containing protein [Bacteroidales bacterium]